MQRWRCKLVGCMLALAALLAVQSSPALAAEQVDLLLVLSSDVSRSVDHPKFLLQREGYAAAISDPHVLDAIKSGPHQRIALCFVECTLNVSTTGERGVEVLGEDDGRLVCDGHARVYRHDGRDARRVQLAPNRLRKAGGEDDERRPWPLKELRCLLFRQEVRNAEAVF